MKQPQSSSAQQITSSNQLECRIVGKLLADHALSNSLTAIVDVPAVYIQQLWRTVRQVPNANNSFHGRQERDHIHYGHIIGYQGPLQRVSAFFTKNLSQPWKTMFKVFNRCLTSQLTGHDQMKINVMQIFHEVINKVHVDYASLLLSDFIHCVMQKKNVIQYPRFTKLIIANFMEKYESIPKRLKVEYHTIKDDTLLVNIYTTGEMTVPAMQIPDDLLTDGIRDTQAHKDYVEKFEGMKKKGKHVAGESSSTRPSLKIRIKQQKTTSTTPLPPSDDHERDDIIEATQLSLALEKTAKVYEE
ncbi:hypothetical protein Tco_1237594 [Tanacetum coccineum]